MDYTKEAQERWGNTKAYSEYSEKVKGYSAEKIAEINEGFDAIFGSFAVCMKNGFAPDSAEAKTLVKKHLPREFGPLHGINGVKDKTDRRYTRQRTQNRGFIEFGDVRRSQEHRSIYY